MNIADPTKKDNNIFNLNGLSVAVTGASGFIGQALVNSCQSRGIKLRALTRTTKMAPCSDGVEWFRGDIRTTQDWAKFFDGVDMVLHMAAELKNPSTMQSINVDGPVRMLDAAIKHGVKRWVQLSSVGAYGASDNGTISEYTPTNPSGPYEVTKTNFDEKLVAAASMSNMEFCIVRPSNVYGPGMRNQSLRQMMRMIAKGWFVYIGSIGASANYVHVDDVVNALILCLTQKPAANQTYIVSDWSTIEDMVRSMAISQNVNAPKIRVPISLVHLIAKSFGWLPGWPLTLGRINALTSFSRYSTQKIEHELGWQVSVPLSIGIKSIASELKT